MGNQKSRTPLITISKRPEIPNRYTNFSRPPIYLAIKDYEAKSGYGKPQELSIKKGDLMEAIYFCIGRDFLLVKKLNDFRYGFVPLESVAELNSLKAQEYFYDDVTRREACNMVMNPEHSSGTFIVRHSQTIPGMYALTVKDFTQTKGFEAKNYRIRMTPRGKYCITPGVAFKTIPEMIAYYQKTVSVCHLVHACPKPEDNRRRTVASFDDMHYLKSVEKNRRQSIGTGKELVLWQKDKKMTREDEEFSDEAYKTLFSMYSSFKDAE